MNIPLEKLTVKGITITGSFWVIQYFFIASAYFYFTGSIIKERHLRIIQQENQRQALENMALKQQKLEDEQEKLVLENAQLRAQINPHFLFNTLGFLYNEVSDSHPQAGEGIAALSDIMRSAIRKPDGDGLIPLEEEVNNIEQLFSIYKLRYNDKVHISFQQKGDSDGLRILPHILNTLVENALKHGELHNAEHPLTITLNISEENIFFQIHNKKRTGPKELSHGIGMSYIRAHLNSVYEGRYTLTIDDTESFYTASLNIAAGVLAAA